MEYDEIEMNESFARIILEQEKDLESLNDHPRGGIDNRYDSESVNEGNRKQNEPIEPTHLDEISLEIFDKDHPFNVTSQGTLLMRHHVKSMKETSKCLDLEGILEELPSRTIGRKKGAKLVADCSAVNRFGSMYRHHHLASIQMDEIDSNGLFDDLASDDGKVDADELRELPVNMALKKRVIKKAKTILEQGDSTSISCLSLWKFKIVMGWRHFKDDFAKFLSSGKLWHYHLKRIEGDFGSGVLSYFTFLRAIFLLSVPSFFLGFLFISMPQLFDRPDKPDCHFTGEGLLTGANCLTNTIMYQGYYVNETIKTVGKAYYNMPLAFLLATLGYFVVCFIWLVRATGIMFRENYIDAKEDGSNFVSKVFCSWDFGIMLEQAALIHHKTLATELKEILAEQRRGGEHRTSCEKFEVFLLRTISWSFYFAIVASSVTAIYFTNKAFICEIKDHAKNNAVFQDLALALVVSSINLILPHVIDWITKLERYKYPHHQLFVSVLRNFIFKMSNLAVICVFWTSENVITCSQAENETSICWETELGQEIFRLIIVDFIFSLIFSTFCAEFLRKVIAKSIGHNPPEFSIANNVMDLIYGQTLCWIGVYFSPLLAFINMLKYFVLFYVKKVSVVNNCRPSTERWRATQSQALFNIVQLVGFLLSTAFLSYVIFNKEPSEFCGPFRGLNRSYDVIVDLLSDMSSASTAWLGFLLSAITSVWILDAIAIAILVMVIFARNRACGLEDISQTLKSQIAIEGKDKALLLKWLQKWRARSKVQSMEEISNGGNPGPARDECQDTGVLVSSSAYANADLDRIVEHSTVSHESPTKSSM